MRSLCFDNALSSNEFGEKEIIHGDRVSNNIVGLYSFIRLCSTSTRICICLWHLLVFPAKVIRARARIVAEDRCEARREQWFLD